MNLDSRLALMLNFCIIGLTMGCSDAPTAGGRGELADAGAEESSGPSKEPSEQASPRIALVIRNISEAGSLKGRGEGALDIAFSPAVWISHTDQILLERGEVASDLVEELAEQGKTGDLRKRMGKLGARGSGLIGPEVEGDYADGLILPNKEVVASFDVEHEEILMFASMFTQSNDTMLGFDEDGVALARLWENKAGIVDVSDELRWWNAGTEVNEPPGEGQSQAECDPKNCEGELEEGTIEPFTTRSPEGDKYPEPSSVAQIWLVDCHVAVDAGPRCSPEE